MATPTFDDPIIVSSNRYLDIEPYGNGLFSSDPATWGSIFPWEFPQNASKHDEQTFLRGFFSDREIHVQGGEAGGYRFLKQVWYCLAEMNAFRRVPLCVDDWFQSETGVGIAGNPNIIKWALSKDAVVATFFNPEERAMYGDKFLTVAMGSIQWRLRQQTVPDIEPVDQASQSNGHLQVPETTSADPATGSAASTPTIVTNQFSSASSASDGLATQQPKSPTTQEQHEPPVTGSRAMTPVENRIATPQFNLPPPKDADHEFHLVGSGKYFPQSGGAPQNPPKRWNSEHRIASHHNLPPIPRAPGLHQPAMDNGMQHYGLHPQRLEPTLPRLSGAQPGAPDSRIVSDPIPTHMRAPQPGHVFNQQHFMPSPVMHAMPHAQVPPQQLVHQYPPQHHVALPRVPQHQAQHIQPVPQHHQWNGMPSGDVRNSLPHGQRVFSNEQYQPTEIYMLKRDLRQDNPMPRGGGRQRGHSNAGRGRAGRQASQSGPMPGDWSMQGQSYNHGHVFPNDAPYFQHRGSVNEGWRHSSQNENFLPAPAQHGPNQNPGPMPQSSPRPGMPVVYPSAPATQFNQMQGAAPQFEMPSATRLRPDGPSFEPHTGPTQSSITETCTHVKKLIAFHIEKDLSPEEVFHYFQELGGGVDRVSPSKPIRGSSAFWVTFYDHRSIKTILDRARENSLPSYRNRAWRVEVPREYWDPTHARYPSAHNGGPPPFPRASGQQYPPTQHTVEMLPQFGLVPQPGAEFHGHRESSASQHVTPSQPINDVPVPLNSSPKKYTKKSNKHNNKYNQRKKSQQSSQPISEASSQAGTIIPPEKHGLQPVTKAKASSSNEQPADHHERAASVEAQVAVDDSVSKTKDVATSSAPSIQDDEEALETSSLDHLNADEPFRAPQTTEEETAKGSETVVEATDPIVAQPQLGASQHSDATTIVVDTAEVSATAEDSSAGAIDNANGETPIADHSINTSSPSSVKSSKDARKVPLPLKPSAAKPLVSTPPRVSTQGFQSPRIVSNDSEKATTPTFHTAPSTPSIATHPVEAEKDKTKNNLDVDDKSTVTNDKEESKAALEAKKNEKQKGPAQTESFSMFSKKEKPGAKKNQKKPKKGDSLKGKPKDFKLATESLKQGHNDANVETGLSTVTSRSVDTATTEHGNLLSSERGEPQMEQLVPGAVAPEGASVEPYGGNTDVQPQDGASMLTIGKNNDPCETNTQPAQELAHYAPHASDDTVETQPTPLDEIANDRLDPDNSDANESSVTAIPSKVKNKKNKRKRNKNKTKTEEITTDNDDYLFLSTNSPNPDQSTPEPPIPAINVDEVDSDRSNAATPPSPTPRPFQKIAALRHIGAASHLSSQRPPNKSIRIQSLTSYAAMKQRKQTSQDGSGSERVTFIVYTPGHNEGFNSERDKLIEESSDEEEVSEGSSPSKGSYGSETDANKNALQVFLIE